jgi:hypothetical protein
MRLALALDASDLPAGEDEMFLWDGTSNDSFKTRLRPDLELLGPVPDLNADLVSIALTIYAADHTVLRRGEGAEWNERLLDVGIPVTDPATWSAVASELAEIARFLTGDEWHFRFRQKPSVAATAALIPNDSTRVVLVSGGADSATGALVSAAELAGGETHTFVSHASNTVARSAQTAAREAVTAFRPGVLRAHHQVFLARATHRLDGTSFDVEPSSRSRSLLFLALGLAVSSQNAVPLWIPENGFASLNPPLTPERVGVLSTRTTQPWFLWRLSQVLSSIGVHAEIVNPFQMLTKGEMFTRVGELLGGDAASTFLSATNSCSHTDQNWHGAPSGTHCGVCFGCIVRRASFNAAGIHDGTRYLTTEGDRFAGYLDAHSSVVAVQDFVIEPFERAMVMAMPLPPSLRARQAYEICLRGRAELGGVV